MINKCKNVDSWVFSDCAKEKPILKGSVEKFLKEKMLNPYSFGHWELRKTGVFKLAGWCFDFSPHLKNYVFKTTDLLEEGYFINKLNVRKIIGTKVLWIQEIK